MNSMKELLDVEVNEKIFKNLVIVAMIIIILILIAVFLNYGIMWNYKVPDDITTKNNGEVEYKIESISTGRKYIEITGWAYKTGQNIGYFDNRIVIRNEETHKYKVMSTKMQIVEEFFSIDDQYDCRRAGLYAKGIAIGLEEGLYQIFIEYKSDGENILVETGIYFNYGL